MYCIGFLSCCFKAMYFIYIAPLHSVRCESLCGWISMCAPLRRRPAGNPPWEVENVRENVQNSNLIQ